MFLAFLCLAWIYINSSHVCLVPMELKLQKNVSCSGSAENQT